MFNLFHSNRRGFSLIELMIVVAIISMLVGVGIPQYSKFRQKAHDSDAKTSLSALFTAQRSFHGEYNFYHTSLQALGYGVEGKHFFNVGFGTQTAVNPIDFGFYPVVDNTIMSTKQICTGTNGTGTDTSCWFVVDVPDLPAETTSTLNTFVAAAVSTPSTYAQNGSFDQMNMIAENVFNIAIHLPEKEMEKLLNMLDKKVNAISNSKGKKTKIFTDTHAIEYLLKNIFSKKKLEQNLL